MKTSITTVLSLAALRGLAATGDKPIPATGRKLSWTVNYLFRVAAGKIVEHWEAWDEGALYFHLTQPAPAPAAK